MTTTEPRLQRYLDHIGYAGQPTVDLTTLRELQRAHLLRVPFENLDIHLGRPIRLENSYAKIVEAGRGGFCYELNSAFGALLSGLGFTVRLLSARVFSAASGFGAEFDHLALLVTLPESDYLVDVGFGEFTLAPLALTLGIEQEDPRGRFVIEAYEAPYLVVRKRVGMSWSPNIYLLPPPATCRSLRPCASITKPARRRRLPVSACARCRPCKGE